MRRFPPPPLALACLLALALPAPAWAAEAFWKEDDNGEYRGAPSAPVCAATPFWEDDESCEYVGAPRAPARAAGQSVPRAEAVKKIPSPAPVRATEQSAPRAGVEKKIPSPAPARAAGQPAPRAAVEKKVAPRSPARAVGQPAPRAAVEKKIAPRSPARAAGQPAPRAAVEKKIAPRAPARAAGQPAPRAAVEKKIAPLAPVLAAGLAGAPAVSAPNGKLSAFGGVRERDRAGQDGLGGLTGSWSAPLGHAYGVQLDGLYGLRDGDIIGGAGVNLFWRDPGRGLLGLTGSWVGWDADKSRGGYTDMFRFGGAGELYFERFTLAGQAGRQFGANTDDGIYGRADLKWYPRPDLALKLGGEYNRHSAGLGRLGLEFQPGFKAVPGLTVFADGAVGEDDYYRVFAGLRIYFGSAKSLKDRHRRDDPENTLADNASLLGRGSVSAAPAPPPAPPPPEPPPPPPEPPPPPPPPEPPPPPPPPEPEPEECVSPQIILPSGICGLPPAIS